jgi:hypothetical protein
MFIDEAMEGQQDREYSHSDEPGEFGEHEGHDEYVPYPYTVLKT